MNELVWVHEDAMRLDHPVFTGTGADRTCVFIFDDALLQAQHYSLKRLQFITETLLEMDVPIYRGDTCKVLLALASKSGASGVRVARSPSPDVNERVTMLRQYLSVEVVEDLPFVPEIDGEYTRFFKFWNKVKSPLLS